MCQCRADMICEGVSKRKIGNILKRLKRLATYLSQTLRDLNKFHMFEDSLIKASLLTLTDITVAL